MKVIIYETGIDNRIETYVTVDNLANCLHGFRRGDF